jgi:hypothetical protein
MISTLTVEDVMARLERQVAYHREQAGFHGGQEAHHRDQREQHTRQAEAFAQHLQAFRAAAVPAVEDLTVAPAPVSLPALDALDAGPRPRVQRLVWEVIQGFAPGEPFGVSKVLDEIGRRYGAILDVPPDPGHVSVALRRLARDGWILRVRRGRPRHEALYVREGEGSEGPTS